MTTAVVTQRRLLPSVVHLASSGRLGRTWRSLRALSPQTTLTWQDIQDMAELTEWLELALNIYGPNTITSNDRDRSEEINIYRILWIHFEIHSTFPERELQSLVEDLKIFQATMQIDVERCQEMASTLQQMEKWLDALLEVDDRYLST